MVMEHNSRSFCYVTDTINGLKLLMEKDEASGKIINIGNPVEHSILEVAHLVKKLAGSDSTISFHPLSEDDPKVRSPIIEKTKELIGLEPEVTLVKGLEQTINEYRKKLGKVETPDEKNLT